MGLLRRSLRSLLAMTNFSNDRILEFAQSFGLRGSGSKNRLQDCEAIFYNFGAGLAVEHRSGSVCENFRRIFKP